MNNKFGNYISPHIYAMPWNDKPGTFMKKSLNDMLLLFRFIIRKRLLKF